MFESLEESERKSEAGSKSVEDAGEEKESSSPYEDASLAPWIAGALILLSFVFAHLGDMKVFAAVTYLAVGVFVVGVFWRFNRHLWFWTAVATLLALHVVLVICVPISAWWLHGKNMVVIATADLIVDFGSIGIFVRLADRQSKNLSETKLDE